MRDAPALPGGQGKLRGPGSLGWVPHSRADGAKAPATGREEASGHGATRWGPHGLRREGQHLALSAVVVGGHPSGQQSTPPSPMVWPHQLGGCSPGPSTHTPPCPQRPPQEGSAEAPASWKGEGNRRHPRHVPAAVTPLCGAPGHDTSSAPAQHGGANGAQHGDLEQGHCSGPTTPGGNSHSPRGGCTPRGPGQRRQPGSGSGWRPRDPPSLAGSGHPGDLEPSAA